MSKHGIGMEWMTKIILLLHDQGILSNPNKSGKVREFGTKTGFPRSLNKTYFITVASPNGANFPLKTLSQIRGIADFSVTNYYR